MLDAPASVLIVDNADLVLRINARPTLRDATASVPETDFALAISELIFDKGSLSAISDAYDLSDCSERALKRAIGFTTLSISSITKCINSSSEI